MNPTPLFCFALQSQFSLWISEHILATNKNQHFVPRCHLKPFTLGGEGLAINLYNLAHKRLIENAPAKNQCSRDYFYGKSSELEGSIQALEGKYADVIRRICADPRPIAEDARFLSAFWIFQHVRTEAIQQSILRHNAELRDALGEDVPDLVLGDKEATLVALSAFANNAAAISDLKVVLIKNLSSTPFVTSDNPAVQTNRWALSNSRMGSATFGMHSAGEIALLPLTPHLLVMLYDKDVYSVPSLDGVTIARNAVDIQALNQHQQLNCTANLYVPPSFNVQHIADLPDLTRQRLSSGPRIEVFQRREAEDPKYYAVQEFDRTTGHEAMFATPTYYAGPSNWPSFLRWRPNGFYFANGSGAGHIRRAWIRSDAATRPFEKRRTGR